MGAQINKHVGVDAADVVLIDPSGDTKGFNTGLGYLSGSLIQKGYRVKVFDFNNNKNNIQARINAIERLDAKYIGFSIKTFTLDSAIEISNSIKKEKKVFIAGGPHITLDPTAFLENNTKFDFGVIFEGEKTLLDLVEGKDFKNIENVAWRQEKSIIVNQKQKYIDNFIRDLDALPFPNYDFFDSLPENRVIYDYPLITSRGCPYPCVYCSVGTVIGKIWRARSPKNIVEELFYAKEKYKSSKFSILDDNFTLGMARAKEICQKIIDEKLNMDWSCPNGVRADRLDEELLGLMKDAGCTSINIGIESLVPDVFDKINKKEKIDQIVNVIEIAKRKKIKINGFFIIGLPGSSFKSDKLSLKYAKQLKLDNALWNLLVPYPGTPLFCSLNTNSDVKILRDWKDGFHFGKEPKVIFETDYYKEKERLKMYYLANLRFKNYAMFVANEKKVYNKLITILKIILKNDPYLLPYHLIRIVLQKIDNLISKRIPPTP